MQRKLQLIDDWNHAWRWASVRCMSGALTIQVAYEAMPETLRANLPHGMVTHASITLLILGIIGRLVKKDDVVSPSQELANRSASLKPKRKPVAGKPLATQSKRTGRSKKRPF